MKKLVSKFKQLNEMPCVKKYGKGHLIAHLLGIQQYSRCFSSIGSWISEGLIKGINEGENTMEMNTSHRHINKEVLEILKPSLLDDPFKGTIKEGCECKYQIINLKDLEKYNDQFVQNDLAIVLDRVLSNIERGREEDNKNAFNNYIVINIDEPYINDIVAILKANGHWDGQIPHEKNIVNDVRAAGDLMLETIIELQRIQSIVYEIDDPVHRPIGVALTELEEKFHKLHNDWSD